MARNLGAGMLGVVHAVADQPSHMLILKSVEHLRPLLAGPHQPGHPQLGQVLGHRRPWLTDPSSQLIDRQFLIDQRPQQAHPGCVRQHPEHLNSELGLLDWQVIQSAIICMHMQIIAQLTSHPELWQRARQHEAADGLLAHSGQADSVATGSW